MTSHCFQGEFFMNMKTINNQTFVKSWVRLQDSMTYLYVMAPLAFLCLLSSFFVGLAYAFDFPNAISPLSVVILSFVLLYMVYCAVAALVRHLYWRAQNAPWVCKDAYARTYKDVGMNRPYNRRGWRVYLICALYYYKKKATPSEETAACIRLCKKALRLTKYL